MSHWKDAPKLYCPTMRATGRSHGWLRLAHGQMLGWTARAGSTSIRASMNGAAHIWLPPRESYLLLRHPIQRLMSAHALFRIPTYGLSWNELVDRVLDGDENEYWLPQTRLHGDVGVLRVHRLEGTTHVFGRPLERLNATDIMRARPEYRARELDNYYKEDLEAWENATPMTE